jgi:hypothetical protein
MKNYLLDISTKGNGDFDELTMAKVLSNVVAFSGDLYSIDYHGVEHGIFMGYEETTETYHIKIIINNFDCPYDIMETVEEIVNNFSRYGTFDTQSKIIENKEPMEIPEYYIEHYYVNSYYDFY